jgi:hypothetical protein
MQIERWEISKTKPYSDNSRANDHAVDAVARSASASRPLSTPKA